MHKGSSIWQSGEVPDNQRKSFNACLQKGGSEKLSLQGGYRASLPGSHFQAQV